MQDDIRAEAGRALSFIAQDTDWRIYFELAKVSIRLSNR